MSTPARRRTLRWAERVCNYLYQQERKERRIWEKEELRQAQILVRLAADSVADPYTQSFIRMYGCAPEKMREKKRQWEAFMFTPSLPESPQLSFDFEAAMLPPKKPVQSVRFAPQLTAVQAKRG
ncbi:MAG: hypothetical protein ACE14M_05080 [Terriglobales bacterium]